MNWRPIVMVGRQFLRCLRSVRTPAVRSTCHSPGMTDGASGYADTINPGPKWTASQADLRDHAVRLRKALALLLAPKLRRLGQTPQQPSI